MIRSSDRRVMSFTGIVSGDLSGQLNSHVERLVHRVEDLDTLPALMVIAVAASAVRQNSSRVATAQAAGLNVNDVFLVELVFLLGGHADVFKPQGELATSRVGLDIVDAAAAQRDAFDDRRVRAQCLDVADAATKSAAFVRTERNDRLTSKRWRSRKLKKAIGKVPHQLG